MYSRFREDSLQNMNVNRSYSRSRSPSPSSAFGPTTTTRLRTTTTRLEIKLPSGLPQLLEILARECIRHQPDGIAEFLASLTDGLLEKRDGEKVRDKAGDGEPSEKVDVESQAAVKIQASYRGYKTRKDLQKAKAKEEKPKPERPEEDVKRDEESAIAAELAPPLRTIREPLPVEEVAAIKIQSGVRGFLTRRRLQAQRSLNNNNRVGVDEYVEPTAPEPTTRSAPHSAHSSQDNSQRSEPDEYDIAVERILKEYGQRPLPSFREDGPKIESRTTSMEIRVEELEAELASLSSGKEDKSELSIALALEEPEPETALSLEDTVDATIESIVQKVEESKVESEPGLGLADRQLKSVDDTDKPESVATEDSNQPVVDSDSSSHNEDSDVEESAYTVNADENEEAGDSHVNTDELEEDSVQLVNSVVLEAESIVRQAVNVAEQVVVNTSKEDSESESTSAPEKEAEVIQVEISNANTNTTREEGDVADEIPKPNADVEPVTIPRAVRDESAESSVPLRHRGRGGSKSVEDKAPEAPVVIRRSKRSTSNTETKYRSGFVEFSPADQKSFDKIAMPHIDETEMDKEIEAEVLNNAAAKIQAGFRGFKARRTLDKAKASATCIQANFRGYKARRKIEQEKKAVVKIQATVRGFLARRRVAKEKLANQQSKRRKSSSGLKLQRRRSSTLNAAAIRIQSAYRGYSVRKSYKEMRQNSGSPVDDLRIEDIGASQGDI